MFLGSRAPVVLQGWVDLTREAYQPWVLPAQLLLETRWQKGKAGR